MKTYQAKEGEFERKWWLVDAEGMVLGRMSTEIAMLLRGKKKAVFTPHIDTGDFVVVVNASKVKLTGKKLTDKLYYRHSGYIGHLKKRTAAELLEKKPEEVILHSVRGMLPKNRLGRKLLTKLKVYPDGDHPHKAQKPILYKASGVSNESN